MKAYKLEKRLTPLFHYDTVVLGGGTAGWTAAVSAARNGCKTALVERLGFIGGTASGGIVVPLSGLYLNGEAVVGGIAMEFAEKMIDAGAATLELPKGHLSYDPETYKVIAMQMLKEAGVELYMNSYFTDCFSENDRVLAVVIENKNGTELIEGDMFIDATGDADLFFKLGLTHEVIPSKLQPMSLCFTLDGVDLSTETVGAYIHHNGVYKKNSCQLDIQECFTKLLNEGKSPQFGGPWFNSLVTGSQIAVNITRAAADATDNRAYTQAEIKLREDMLTLTDLLKKTYPEFKNAYISSAAVNAGIRETRHIKSKKPLTGEALVSGSSDNDTVAYAAHPIDIHMNEGSGQILKRLTKPGAIPYSSLVNGDIANVVAAGRSIDADSNAYASVRVQATVMAMGEAAGIATALALKGNRDVRELNGSDILSIINGNKQ